MLLLLWCLPGFFVVFLDLMNEGMGRLVFSFVIKHVCVDVCACPKK
jgi:hypothetical protein